MQQRLKHRKHKGRHVDLTTFDSLWESKSGMNVHDRSCRWRSLVDRRDLPVQTGDRDNYTQLSHQCLKNTQRKEWERERETERERERETLRWHWCFSSKILNPSKPNIRMICTILTSNGHPFNKTIGTKAMSQCLFGVIEAQLYSTFRNFEWIACYETRVLW